jgi:glyoxylase-like metal-dependent hydrolase (beta-lactamase superfamily II)
MIKIKTFIFNPFLVNALVLSDETGECIIIDASCYSQKEKEDIDEYIASHKLKPVKIVNTHSHVDHVLGIAYVAKKYNIKVEIHKGDLQLYSQATKQGIIFGFSVEALPQVDSYLSLDILH